MKGEGEAALTAHDGTRIGCAAVHPFGSRNADFVSEIKKKRRFWERNKAFCSRYAYNRSLKYP